MSKLQGRPRVALWFFAMLFVLGGLASAQPAPQPAVAEPQFLLWLAGGIAEVCYEPFNGCQPEAPGPCCWRCPGGPATWSCTTASSAAQCKSKCGTACGTTCGWI